MRQPKSLDELLLEDSVGVRIQLPESLHNTVTKYRDAFRAKSGRVISIEKVIIKALAIAADDLETTANELISELQNH